MISDKYQVRSVGSVDPVTLQPLKGRKMGGGVRFGEMERDTMIAHGASFSLQDRLLYSSDLEYVKACYRCGSIASVSRIKSNVGLAALMVCPNLVRGLSSLFQNSEAGTGTQMNHYAPVCLICRKTDKVSQPKR